MSDLSEFFESLYSHFILRDVLAKVIPGLIGLAAVLSLIMPRIAPRFLSQFRHLDLIAVVITYGVAFMFGMLLQYLGTRLPFLTIHVWEGDEKHTSVQVSLGNAAKFMEAAKERPGLLRQRERLAILKEMSANYATALVLPLLCALRLAFGLVRGNSQQATVVALVLAIGIVALVFQNRFHSMEQRAWEESVIDLLKPIRGRRTLSAG